MAYAVEEQARRRTTLALAIAAGVVAMVVALVAVLMLRGGGPPPRGVAGGGDDVCRAVIGRSVIRRATLAAAGRMVVALRGYWTDARPAQRGAYLVGADLMAAGWGAASGWLSLVVHSRDRSRGANRRPSASRSPRAGLGRLPAKMP